MVEFADSCHGARFRLPSREYWGNAFSEELSRLATLSDQYQWMDVGWQELTRIYRTIIHFDIKDGKIWLQQNLTELNPAEDLVAMGIA